MPVKTVICVVHPVNKKERTSRGKKADGKTSSHVQRKTRITDDDLRGRIMLRNGQPVNDTCSKASKRTFLLTTKIISVKKESELCNNV